MELVVAVALLVAVFAFVIGVRSRDLPPPEAVSPTLHLEDKKARIYEGLRDLQFEYRVGKLSDADYQRTKTDLQKELAGVMAQIDKIAPPPAAASAGASKQAPAAAAAAPAGCSCNSCGTKFDKPMKFCGHCGKAIAEGAATA
jgi:hypothetical protein